MFDNILKFKMLRLSILNLIIAALVLMALFVFLFVKWHSNSLKLRELHSEISQKEQNLHDIEIRGEKVLRFVRIKKCLDILVNQKMTERQKFELAMRLWKISRDYNIDPLLILAIVHNESRGNHLARGTFVSGKYSGALGLMQIKYETAQDMANSMGIKLESENDLFDPEINLMVGTAYLMRLIAKYNSLQYALVAYNIGFGNMNASLKNNEPLPTKYYKGVMASYKRFTEKIF